MLEVYAEEFVKLTAFLLKKEDVKKITGFILIKKSKLAEYLDKNAYETVQNKIKTWKLLNWIDTDEGRLTKRMLEGNKQVTYIKIDLKVYEKLAELIRKGKEKK